MTMYELDELFAVLEQNKITKNKESVRRWLRQGKIQGTKGAGPKRNGWQVSEEALQRFLNERLPHQFREETEDAPAALSEEEQERLGKRDDRTFWTSLPPKTSGKGASCSGKRASTIVWIIAGWKIRIPGSIS